ncbi:type 4a pilus biogenesis protein PilO [Halomonas sp. YLGW01]|uniref:type 4a pilus biogenesis protein PilO n=1 Tax=Halomonas sp. YLGW01 TaxID=2773308 RepID=UPI0017818392|nr:type 4a pilus biogenesis protein PilO [Halomonas sp. YLGW01]
MNLSAEWRRLRELDWRELDIKEAGGWPWSLQFGCFLLALGLAFAGMNWYLAAPKLESLEEARQQEQTLLRDYRSKAAGAARLPPLIDQAEALESRLEGLLKLLPDGAEIPSLVDDISKAALDNQLAIDAIRLRAPINQEHYTERPFDIRVRGDYHRIASFLAAVAALPRIVTQHDFTLAPAGNAGELQLSMLARTYSDVEKAAPQGQGGSTR